MPNDNPTADELRTLLATLLEGAAGGTVVEWRELIGEIERLPIAMNPRCDWRVTPTGTAAQVEAIQRAVELVREAHPYVRV